MAQMDNLFGRRDIFTSYEVIDDSNILSVVNDALKIHKDNMSEEEYLLDYRKGNQPVLDRTKERNDFVCNKIVENHADEIVTFKNGYFLTQPAKYVARNAESSEKVKEYNEYVYLSGKHEADNEVVNYFHTCGKGYLYVEPNAEEDGDVIPAHCYALDPRNAFVIKSLGPSHKPMVGCNAVAIDKTIYVDAYTADKVYRLKGGQQQNEPTEDPDFDLSVSEVIETNPNQIAPYIPIIEYSYNEVNMGAFEGVLPLLDALNTVQSNRVDGVEQFIQSLLVAINVDFEEGTTADTVRESGMVSLKSVGENKADIKLISEQLNQSETQVLTDYLYQQILTICSMPQVTKGGSSTSDTGAAVLFRDGWQQADSAARNTEDIFKKSNKYFDDVMLKILEIKNHFELLKGDFELQFVRNEMSNIQSKAQSCATMLEMGMAPELAFAKSGISNDPVADVAQSEEYLNIKQGYNTQNETVDNTAVVNETPVTENIE